MNKLKHLLEWAIWHVSLRRCYCCCARNRSVVAYPSKGGMRLCGSCATVCEGDCNGVQIGRQRENL